MDPALALGLKESEWGTGPAALLFTGGQAPAPPDSVGAKVNSYRLLPAAPP